MRRFFIIVALLAFLASPSIAQDHSYYFTEQLSVSDSPFSLAWTNNYKNPWQFVSFSYSLPENVTNLTTVSLLRASEVDQYQQPLVTTNPSGIVSTNQMWVVTNRIMRVTTNLMFALHTSNVVSVVADGASVAQVYVLPFDVLVFDFETNSPFSFDANR